MNKYAFAFFLTLISFSLIKAAAADVARQPQSPTGSVASVRSTDEGSDMFVWFQEETNEGRICVHSGGRLCFPSQEAQSLFVEDFKIFNKRFAVSSVTIVPGYIAICMNPRLKDVFNALVLKHGITETTPVKESAFEGQ